MKMDQGKIFFSAVCALTLLIPFVANAANQASAAGDLADIAAISVQAKANLADSALGGNIDEIVEAGKRSDAVDAAMAQAQNAFAAMERALSSGDEDAAQSAADELTASKQKAMDALNGVIPASLAKDAVEEWKASKTNTGSGPGRPYDPPNIYDVPWQTVGMRNFYTSQFGNFWSSGRGNGDKDATPE